MKKDMIFFSADGKGLTSTSANHIANLAKEMIRDIEVSLEGMTLYSTTVTLIGSEKPAVLNHGATAADVEDVISRLHTVADAKSLIAWLREAIKAKERLHDETTGMTLAEYAKIKGIKIVEPPVPGDALTEDEYFASKPLDERCRYYSLETLAATLGKAVHPGGEFAEARNELQAKAKSPHTVSGAGRDALIYTYQPTVDSQVVEDVYFRLQKQYRDAQARLNEMRHECRRAVEESVVAAKAEYTKAVAAWSVDRKLLEAQFNEYVQRKTKEIAALRILIPDALKDIYETVSDLGKKTEKGV